jgi:glycosyltransferase involved in cell wall biosynthesis
MASKITVAKSPHILFNKRNTLAENKMQSLLTERELLFILPTYGQFNYARSCVESIVKNTQPGTYTIAIIDDGSPDWAAQNISQWPSCPKFCVHFAENNGLTRSWNLGLNLARTYGFKYAICGNSDLLVTEGWFEPLKEALETGFDLVGPITNAPGHANWQSLRQYCRFKATDDRAYLNSIARMVRGYHSNGAIGCNYINGFCMLAKTETWWAGAINDGNVFDPKYKLTGNEDELQKRWKQANRVFGFVPQSFVFHYRSVSRPDALVCWASKGAFRNESPSSDDRVQQNEHRQLVDEGVAECGEVCGCQTSSGAQL